MPAYTKTKLISIRTLNQAIFDPHTKPSQFWCLHWNQANSDPPHWHHVYFDHPHKKVHFDADTKTKSFSGRVKKNCVVYISHRYMFLWYSSSNTYNIITITRVHINQDPILCVKIAVYMDFRVHRGSWLLWPRVIVPARILLDVSILQ